MKDGLIKKLFIEYLLDDGLDGMNEYMNYLTLDIISSFDVADSNRVSPENFYHGFVLGLITNLKNRYEITSNRESGTGKYDVMIEPKDRTKAGIIIEFKVIDEDEDEYTLEDCANNALKQIEALEQNWHRKWEIETELYLDDSFNRSLAEPYYIYYDKNKK